MQLCGIYLDEVDFIFVVRNFTAKEDKNGRLIFPYSVFNWNSISEENLGKNINGTVFCIANSLNITEAKLTLLDYLDDIIADIEDELVAYREGRDELKASLKIIAVKHTVV